MISRGVLIKQYTKGKEISVSWRQKRNSVEKQKIQIF